MILARSCPLCVSMTKSTSFPASKPGPSATVRGAMSLVVPRFLFARIASISASGFNSFTASPLSSTRIGRSPFSQTFWHSLTFVISLPVTPSTQEVPDSRIDIIDRSPRWQDLLLRERSVLSCVPCYFYSFLLLSAFSCMTLSTALTIF